MKSLFCNLIIVRNCNLRCQSCGAWKHGGKIINFAHWKKVIDRAFSYNRPKMVGITGGEPLFHPDVYKIINYVHSLKIIVGINSNGTLPLAKYQSLLKTNVNSIGISLHFYSPDDQDKFCGSVGAYQKIISTLRYLKAHRGNKFVYVQCTLSGLNYKQFVNLKKFINQDIGLPVFATPATWGVGESILKTTNRKLSKVDTDFPKFKKIIKKNFGVGIMRTHTYIDIALKAFETGQKQWSCNAGHHYYSISPTGNFCVCQDYETPVNFQHDNYLSQLQDPAFFNKWDNITNKCSGCTYPCYLEMEMASKKPWELIPKGLAYLYWKYIRR